LFCCYKETYSEFFVLSELVDFFRFYWNLMHDCECGPAYGFVVASRGQGPICIVKGQQMLTPYEVCDGWLN
jgi:hypothetical protein